MKACSSCQRLFPDDGRFCPVDGTALKPTAEVPVVADPEDARVGETLCDGRYHIRRTVADGGMGRVYQAEDTQANRSVAIKVLHPEVAVDDIALERFKREFELSSRLPHDHIVEVLDFLETEDDTYALVMEYLEGEELRSAMQRDKLVRAERVIRMLSQLAIGLREPHQLKLVHRDIKPDNIFLCGTEDGPIVKLLDFGSVRDNSEGAKKLTVIGTTIGSPYYMSPEQAQGLPDLDQRADVWSIAAIAYEALTGKVPFYGVTGPQILLAILGKEPTPPSLVANEDGFKGEKIPEALDDVMSDALSKGAATRLMTVAELADRVGDAYGLTGTHEEWARIPETELAERLTKAASGGAKPSRRPVPPRDEPVEDDGPRVNERPLEVVKPDNPFDDENFIMGVPDPSSPNKRYVIFGIVGVVLLLGVLAFALR